MILYKYRSLDNWQFLLDILINKHFYAADFSLLNDPMEGQYRYTKGKVSRQFKEAVLESKLRWRICSLSPKSRNTLMWAHYAEGHTGVAIGVQLPDEPGFLDPQRQFDFRKVTYDNTLEIAETAGDLEELAKAILTRKLMAWCYEEEYRVLTPKAYVPVAINEILLGCKIREEHEKLLRDLIDEIALNAPITKLSTRDLDD